ncbi:hypothetical protein ACLOJK_014787 [Asimina triloba]
MEWVLSNFAITVQFGATIEDETRRCAWLFGGAMVVTRFAGRRCPWMIGGAWPPEFRFEICTCRYLARLRPCAADFVGSNGFEDPCCLRQMPMLVNLPGSSIGAGGHDLLLLAAAQIWVDGGAD